MSEVIPLEDENNAGCLLLWAAVFCLFLFLGTMYVRRPEEQGGTAFPLFSPLASKMDAAAEELRQGNVCQVFFGWDDDRAETNLGS